MEPPEWVQKSACNYAYTHTNSYKAMSHLNPERNKAWRSAHNVISSIRILVFWWKFKIFNCGKIAPNIKLAVSVSLECAGQRHSAGPQGCAGTSIWQEIFLVIFLFWLLIHDVIFLWPLPFFFLGSVQKQKPCKLWAPCALSRIHKDDATELHS